MESVRWRNRSAARFVARGVRADTICGSSNSSVIARPSAIRSGQNARSTPSRVPKQLLDAPGHAREHRAAQHHELARAEVVHELPDGAGHCLGIRAEVLVDGSPHHHDHDLGTLDHRHVVVGHEGARGQCPGQVLVDARLEERRDAGADGRHRLVVDVVDRHLQPPGGQGDREREADVTGSTHDAHIHVEGPHVRLLVLGNGANLPPRRQRPLQGGAISRRSFAKHLPTPWVV